jgi:hypothetical protein
MNLRVVGSAGTGNVMDDVIDGLSNDMDLEEILELARGCALLRLEFEYRPLIICDDGRELHPEHWHLLGRPASGSKVSE